MRSKIKLSSLHLLLTYQCTFECEHCFVWGSPWQNGVMSLKDVVNIIDQAREIKSVNSIYFEGGEPFLYYPILVAGIDYAHKHGYKVGIVTNGFWATDLNDTILWLKPFAGKIDDLSVSTDLFHYDMTISQHSVNIQEACAQLDIPIDTISIQQPDKDPLINDGSLMYRGRAADKLAGGREKTHYLVLASCPYEDLMNPGRFHIDPLGYIHICQGIVAGNIYQTPLHEIIGRYSPEEHPIIKSLILGGPQRLAKDFNVPIKLYYADACHMCYETRTLIRRNENQYLEPDQVYGIY